MGGVPTKTEFYNAIDSLFLLVFIVFQMQVRTC